MGASGADGARLVGGFPASAASALVTAGGLRRRRRRGGHGAPGRDAGHRPFGFASGALLLSVFTVAIAAAMSRGDRVPCRCFGASTTRLGLPHVARNLALVAVCATGLVATVSATGPVRHPAGIATALVCAATVVGLAARLDDLVALFAPGWHPGPSDA